MNPETAQIADEMDALPSDKPRALELAEHVYGVGFEKAEEILNILCEQHAEITATRELLDRIADTPLKLQIARQEIERLKKRIELIRCPVAD